MVAGAVLRTAKHNEADYHTSRLTHARFNRAMWLTLSSFAMTRNICATRTPTVSAPMDRAMGLKSNILIGVDMAVC